MHCLQSVLSTTTRMFHHLSTDNFHHHKDLEVLLRTIFLIFLLAILDCRYDRNTAGYLNSGPRPQSEMYYLKVQLENFVDE